jgi:hypothetical protein
VYATPGVQGLDQFIHQGGDGLVSLSKPFHLPDCVEYRRVMPAVVDGVLHPPTCLARYIETCRLKHSDCLLPGTLPGPR